MLTRLLLGHSPDVVAEQNCPALHVKSLPAVFGGSSSLEQCFLDPDMVGSSGMSLCWFEVPPK